MNLKTTIVLLALLAACGLYVVLAHTDLLRRAKGPAERDREGAVFGTAPQDVVRIAITAVEARKRVFVRRDDAWYIAEPVEAKAIDYEVDRIADALKGLKAGSVHSPGDEDLPDDEITGLDKPRWTITFVDARDETRTVRVGRNVPLEDNRLYLRRDGDDRIFVVETQLRSALDQPLNEFRDKDVLDVRADDIVRILIEREKTYELRKGSDGTWGIYRPVSCRADQQKARDLASDIAALRVGKFLDDEAENLADYRLDRPAITLHVTTARKEPTTSATAPATQEATERTYTVIFSRPGSRDGSVNAMIVGQKTVFQFAKGALERLRPKLDDLRDKRVLEFAADDVNRIEIAGRGRPDAVLVKEKDEWRLDEPYAGRASQSAARNLLDTLSSLEAQNFRDETANLEVFGLASPRARIKLHVAGKGQVVALLIGRETPTGAAVYVKVATAAAVAAIKADDAKVLLAAPASYWDNEILRVDRSAVRGIAVRRKDGSFALQRGEGDGKDTWSLVEPIRAPGDQDHVRNILDDLTELKASGIVALAPTAPQTYAEADNRISVTLRTVTERVLAGRRPETQPAAAPVTRPATAPVTAPATAPATQPAVQVEEKTYRLEVCKVGNDAFAWRPQQDIVPVGKFPERLHDNLAAELRDRTVFRVEANKVDVIRLVRGDDELELRRKDDAWAMLRDPAVKIDGQKVRDFLNDLDGMKAERFAAYSSDAAGDYGLDQPQLTVELRTTEATHERIHLSARGPDKAEGRFAATSAVDGVFVLGPASVDRIDKSLDDFRAE
jgi:hypothetical protein